MTQTWASEVSSEDTKCHLTVGKGPELAWEKGNYQLALEGLTHPSIRPFNFLWSCLGHEANVGDTHIRTAVLSMQPS